MTYHLAERLDRVGTRMKEININSLTYRRGAVEITITNFTPEALNVTQLALYGVTLITDKAQDFVFDANELSSLAPPLPNIGDEIEWDGNTFEVFNLGDALYRFTTSSRARLRVHTKQVA